MSVHRTLGPVTSLPVAACTLCLQYLLYFSTLPPPHHSLAVRQYLVIIRRVTRTRIRLYYLNLCQLNRIAECDLNYAVETDYAGSNLFIIDIFLQLVIIGGNDPLINFNTIKTTLLTNNYNVLCST